MGILAAILEEWGICDVGEEAKQRQLFAFSREDIDCHALCLEPLNLEFYSESRCIEKGTPCQEDRCSAGRWEGTSPAETALARSATQQKVPYRSFSLVFWSMKHQTKIRSCAGTGPDPGLASVETSIDILARAGGPSFRILSDPWLPSNALGWSLSHREQRGWTAPFPFNEGETSKGGAASVAWVPASYR
ncbi:uncharacterized protein PAC_00730 [Phialocephala subalpina]|uniref:Uncharacterized protein n=1 Tax=Phialocephala subalpina TaxID=576137 RepID=A0A1L7WDK0_9HELO|nr:uncharacterized protein PAC_00730 [Phialocephala subalpina]